ncbi:hypothetical protein LT679_07205 [Mucilaginibacter roseus]|uniref:Phage tail tape measure protein n=1 Tax=Mucilaginibacter roseus TaxID=1528868 RepID=A0ABS8U2T4_9SPHI|nr:hypothetical protein [Mucilaginibacter roseus]MCD8740385.1 hypothetical protein [Mucilaginibacter roseus]
MANTYNIEDQLKAQQEAVDELRDSLTEVISIYPKFAQGFEAGLSALGEKLPEVVESIKQLNTQNRELVASGQKPQSVLKQLASSLLSWNSVISVGITLLSVYGKEILSWVSSLLKGEQRLTAYGKALKDSRIVMGALIEVQKRGNLSAQDELVKLKLLYNATQDVTLGITERKKAVNALQEKYPAYFKNVKDEAILAGQAKSQYDQLAQSIIATARARAAENLIVNNEQRKLTNETRAGKFNDELKAQQKELDAARKHQKELDKVPMQVSSMGVPVSASGSFGYIEINELEEKVKRTQKSIADLSTDTMLLNKQNNVLVKAVEDDVKKYGIGLLLDTKKNNAEINNSYRTTIKEQDDLFRSASQERLEEIAGQTIQTLKSYEEQIKTAEAYFNKLRAGHAKNKKDIEQIDKEQAKTLKAISNKFQQEDVAQLQRYEDELKQLKLDNIEDVTAREQVRLKQETEDRNKQYEEEYKVLDERIKHRTKLLEKDDGLTLAEKVKLKETIAQEQKLLEDMAAWKEQFDTRQWQKQNALNQQNAQPDKSQEEQDKLRNAITENEQNGKHLQALLLQQQLLDLQHQQAVTAAQKRSESVEKIEADYAAKRAALEQDLVSAKLHAGDKLIDGVLKNSKKDSAIFKAAFVAKKATAVGDIIISTRKAIMESLQAYSGIPFIGQALGIAQAAFMAAQGATSIADIVKQKPGYAQGGRFISDGRGALLGGYSRTDDTNAYLRSGEAVVVSEAMRNPWARNLVSAINVAYGGRDFSTGNTSPAYALGGVYTDGGNAGRYYSQPVNDVKEMANTLAYQIINNFPPVYVDVKDINTQQSILARTVDRVNL